MFTGMTRFRDPWFPFMNQVGIWNIRAGLSSFLHMKIYGLMGALKSDGVMGKVGRFNPLKEAIMTSSRTWSRARVEGRRIGA